ncbi:hypothetical protein PCS_00646 [Desulfocurvibacter africanus PCS]|uniref:Uncharacterized protein n=1 Tax=Desulfocurvibacter africanus PCS TaxID=1262666 RepID=M5PY74_DESAF|nr:hypothetical protein PCS_00646 [Desulfocurvibacter africanus PCS]
MSGRPMIVSMELSLSTCSLGSIHSVKTDRAQSGRVHSKGADPTGVGLPMMVFMYSLISVTSRSSRVALVR